MLYNEVFTRRIHSIPDISEVGEVRDQGVTYPVSCILENGIQAYVKYQRNPCGNQVLINEFIGNSIPDVVGLTKLWYL